MKRSSPIGVFDSGVGGLTILNQLADELPFEDFIYFGDSKYFPYGTKTKEEIEDRVQKISLYFESLNVKAIVIACNSASSNSSCLKNRIHTRVINVIEPAARKALDITVNNRIILLGTQLTVSSGQYNKYIDGKAKLYSLPCTSFVELVENGDLSNKKYIQSVIDDHLSALKDKGADTVILGCTHFGLIKDEIQNSLKETSIVECGIPVLQTLKDYLEAYGLLNNKKTVGTITLATSGCRFDMESKIKWFNKPYQGIEKLDI